MDISIIKKQFPYFDEKQFKEHVEIVFAKVGDAFLTGKFSLFLEGKLSKGYQRYLEAKNYRILVYGNQKFVDADIIDYTYQNGLSYMLVRVHRETDRETDSLFGTDTTPDLFSNDEFLSYDYLQFVFEDNDWKLSHYSTTKPFSFPQLHK
ncbi:hypothetical protein PP175_26430 (plasmid) [Aneurinibacillus sp. Ricciae_BoGa-3]|uniref:hypothetical protein n=1 Tax=Aneurinibacillus sp. Ricciae_BoGa-3 TaxID=3022697 RepID=UPI0023417669|nr:hypothetical protein [Aneurinibacillus sp. Ricciae_BoGa-3]WCK57604.1 hypothetical protein PP175_26430 [Aneurinibacillus sp. Ricciae_BoGa-3]